MQRTPISLDYGCKSHYRDKYWRWVNLTDIAVTDVDSISKSRKNPRKKWWLELPWVLNLKIRWLNNLGKAFPDSTWPCLNPPLHWNGDPGPTGAGVLQDVGVEASVAVGFRNSEWALVLVDDFPSSQCWMTSQFSCHWLKTLYGIKINILEIHAFKSN